MAITREMLEAEFYDTIKTAEILGVNRKRISSLLLQNRLKGAFKFSDVWLIPKEAVDNFQRKPQGNFTNHPRKTRREEAREEINSWLARAGYGSDGRRENTESAE